MPPFNYPESWRTALDAKRPPVVYDRKDAEASAVVVEMNLLDIHVVPLDDPEAVAFHWVVSDRPVGGDAEALIQEDREKIQEAAGLINGEGLTIRTHVSKSRRNAGSLVDFYRDFGFGIVEETEERFLIERGPGWVVDEAARGRFEHHLPDRYAKRLARNACKCPCHKADIAPTVFKHDCCERAAA